MKERINHEPSFHCTLNNSNSKQLLCRKSDLPFGLKKIYLQYSLFDTIFNQLRVLKNCTIYTFFAGIFPI